MPTAGSPSQMLENQRQEAFELSSSSSHVSSRSICRSEVRSNLFDVVEESGGLRLPTRGKTLTCHWQFYNHSRSQRQFPLLASPCALNQSAIWPKWQSWSPAWVRWCHSHLVSVVAAGQLVCKPQTPGQPECKGAVLCRHLRWHSPPHVTFHPCVADR